MVLLLVFAIIVCIVDIVIREVDLPNSKFDFFFLYFSLTSDKVCLFSCLCTMQQIRSLTISKNKYMMLNFQTLVQGSYNKAFPLFNFNI